jgi:hypothetical protein
MLDLTENERGQIIGLYKIGTSKVKFSKILGFPRTMERVGNENS